MIYADNAATTRIADSVLEKMLPFLKEQYGNASSQYSLGVGAKRAIEHARIQVANAICADPSEIIFTSGGSEGNSWVISSIENMEGCKSCHVVTSSIEHSSILKSCTMLKHKQMLLSLVLPNTEGTILTKDVLGVLQPNTKLVSIMMANNEVGTVQPIREIKEALTGRDIVFHSDAVQAVGHIPVNVNHLGVDYLTASAHKFNGPKGVGFIYIKKNSSIRPMIMGGEQELSKRAGTENVASIVGLGYALEISIKEMAATTQKLSKLVSHTIDGLRYIIPEVIINSENAKHLPGIINVSLPKVSGEAMMNMLDMKGVCVSTGSACHAGKNEPSHVLMAMGLSEKQANSTIRISYGRDNSEDDVETILTAISSAYNKIKQNI